MIKPQKPTNLHFDFYFQSGGICHVLETGMPRHQIQKLLVTICIFSGPKPRAFEGYLPEPDGCISPLSFALLGGIEARLYCCREGRGNAAFEPLEELRKKDSSIGERTSKNLLDELHFQSRE
ncbi:hypothetical protein HHK36_021260 [Tetracentron sinense]|uniref:Uncharacterized protein n=1 Tax=Tetracentron sinense TaxID=13715 RepID=A0A835DAH2_TETSI|nr:hypothetical protein HHK36_021260 [Tetracentron sinense]